MGQNSVAADISTVTVRVPMTIRRRGGRKLVSNRPIASDSGRLAGTELIRSLLHRCKHRRFH